MGFDKKALLGTMIGAGISLLNPGSGPLNEDTLMTFGSTLLTQNIVNNAASVAGNYIGSSISAGYASNVGDFFAGAAHHLGGDFAEGIGKIIPNAMGYATDGGNQLYKNANQLNNMVIDLYTQTMDPNKLQSAFTVAR